MVAEAEDWWSRWKGTLCIGCVYEHLGEYRQALEQFDAALQIIDTSPDEQAATFGRLYVHANIANVYIDCGDYEAAAGIARECLDDAEKLSHREQHIEAQINLGVCAFALGRLGEAHQRLHRALEIARFVGDAGRTAVTRAWLCGLYASIGQYDTAKELGKDALQLALQTGSQRSVLYAHQHLGDAYLRGSLPREALYHYRQATSIARDQHVPYYEALLTERSGVAELRLGQPERAATLCGTALELSDRIGAREIEAAAHVGLSLAGLALGRMERRVARRSARLRSRSRSRCRAAGPRARRSGAHGAGEGRSGRCRRHSAAAVAVSSASAPMCAARGSRMACWRRRSGNRSTWNAPGSSRCWVVRRRARLFLEGAEWPPLERRFAAERASP